MKLQAKKSLGQHFLNSKHVLEQIIRAGQLKKGELVLEIGPGTGILTQALLKEGISVVAVEKDVRAIEVLQEKFAPEIKSGQLKLISGDILDNSIFNTSPKSTNLTSSILNQPFSLIANIPYYITGAILEKFLEHGPRPERMVLLVQKEVAERIVARDGKESVLSVSVKVFGTPRIVANVPRGAFTPPPTVDSAILEISNISDDSFQQTSKQKDRKDVDITRFFSIVRAGFAHKRKFLIRNLETVLGKEILEKKWQKLKLDSKVRAEDLELGKWVEIAE